MNAEISEVAGTNTSYTMPGMSDTPLSVLYDNCLLYTSDAADERSSVDLGGRRIIKNKTCLFRHTLLATDDTMCDTTSHHHRLQQYS